MFINIGIVGATGYAGEELIKILLRHPQIRIAGLYAKIDQPQAISRLPLSTPKAGGLRKKV
jgi:N-acetyl-gamma-glutamylphosphate reductase